MGPLGHLFANTGTALCERVVTESVGISQHKTLEKESGIESADSIDMKGLPFLFPDPGVFPQIFMTYKTSIFSSAPLL